MKHIYLTLYLKTGSVYTQSCTREIKLDILGVSTATTIFWDLAVSKDYRGCYFRSAKSKMAAIKTGSNDVSACRQVRNKFQRLHPCFKDLAFTWHYRTVFVLQYSSFSSSKT